MKGRLIYLMGPSGSGKDSLIEAARTPLLAQGCEVARRIITRSAQAMGEDAIGVSREEFERRRQAREFALHWSANGLDYAIPASIDHWLENGRDVLVNGSRGHLAHALARYPALLPVLLTVKDDVLRERLLQRGRESLSEIDARLKRNEMFMSDDAVHIHRLDNSGHLATTVAQLLDLLRLSAEPDQT